MHRLLFLLMPSSIPHLALAPQVCLSRPALISWGMDQGRYPPVLVRLSGELGDLFYEYVARSGMEGNRAEAARQLIYRGLFIDSKPAGFVSEIAFRIAIQQATMTIMQELARSALGPQMSHLKGVVSAAAARLGVEL